VLPTSLYPRGAGPRNPSMALRVALSIVEGQQKPACRFSEPKITTEEDAQGMANVDNGLATPEKVGEQPGAPARTRAGKPAGPAFKPMHHEDMDPKEFAAMLDIYDDSFRNMAEGEVVKGTVLKVTETAVVVDVGYKSEGLIQINEFLDETGQVTVQAGDVVDVLLERTEDRERR
jgi:hypothetical protein